MPVVVDYRIYHKYPGKLVKYYKSFNTLQTVFISDRGPENLKLWTRIEPDQISKYVYTHTIHHNRHDKKIYIQNTKFNSITESESSSYNSDFTIRSNTCKKSGNILDMTGILDNIRDSASCSTCKYHSFGVCRYLPPFLNGFPRVTSSDWCSKYMKE